MALPGWHKIYGETLDSATRKLEALETRTREEAVAQPEPGESAAEHAAYLVALNEEYDEYKRLYDELMDEVKTAAVEQRKADPESIDDPDEIEAFKEEAWMAATALAAMEAKQEAEQAEAQRQQTLGILDQAKETFKWATSRPQFKEQCFLLSNIFELTEHKIKKDGEQTYQGKWLPYVDSATINASLLIDGDPYRVMNRLTQYPSQRYFHDIRAHELSHLQPMIRLFKVREITAAAPYKAEVEEAPPSTTLSEQLQEFKFDSHLAATDVSKILSDRNTRGVGVGIQNFTFSYEADNPFAIKKSIKAKLTIFANSFNELLRDRGGYAYADLALKTGSELMRNFAAPQQPDAVYDNLDKLNFRLKAVVGWAIPNGNTSFGADSNALDAINDSFITLNLTPTVHTFDIDDLGRVKFTINYLAYVEDYFDQPGFNIFTDQDVAYNNMARKLQYQTLVKNCAKADELADLKKDWQEQIEYDKKKATKSLMGDMAGECKDDGSTTSLIYVLEMPYKDINEWKTKGAYYDYDGDLLISLGVDESWMDEVADGAFGAHEDPPDEPEEESLWQSTLKFLSEVGPDTPYNIKTRAAAKIQDDARHSADQPLQEGTHIPYFYVSDLVDTILWGIGRNLGPNNLYSQVDSVEDAGVDEKAAEKRRLLRSREQFERLRVVLGPLEITNPKKPSESRYVSLGDLPISVKYFVEWLTAKLLKTETIVYTLSQFLNEFLNELIREFLNNDECFNGQLRQPTRLSQAAITSYRDDNKRGTPDEITKATNMGTRRLNTADINTFPLLNIAGDREDPRGVPAGGGLDREMNYLVYFAGRIMPAEQATGDVDTDAGRGIFHYGIGRDRGLVKTINFKKTPAKGLKELRFEQQGYDGLQQLREQYDVEIKSFANVTTFPGVYIYVDPFSVSPSTNTDLTQMGIGGYHMIIRSEHSFGAGVAESTITAKWVAERYSGTDPASTTLAAAKKCTGRGMG